MAHLQRGLRQRQQRAPLDDCKRREEHPEKFVRPAPVETGNMISSETKRLGMLAPKDSNRYRSPPSMQQPHIPSLSQPKPISKQVTQRITEMGPAPKHVPLKDRKCPFCPIIQDIKKAVTRVYHDDAWDENFLVIQPIGPVTEGHVIVIPRKHVQDATSDREVYGHTSNCAALVAQTLYPGIDVNIDTNCGENADQTVPHLHIHVIPRRHGDGLVHPWSGQEPDRYNTVGHPLHPLEVLPTFHPRRRGTA